MHRRNYKGRKLGREKGPRRALLRNLATSVILYEKVRTTKTKAKEIQPIVENMITLAKKGDLNATKKLFGYLLDTNAVVKLKTELAPIYKERNGGYTRIVSLGFRVGDGAQEAIIELLDTDKILKKEVKEKAVKKEVKKTETTESPKEEKEDKPKTEKKEEIKK